MELSSPVLNTLKVGTKNGYLLVDPDSSEDAKVIILSDDSNKEIIQGDDNLVVYGPGDFEASGILIKGNRIDDNTLYSIDADEGKLLIVSSMALTKLSDEDEYDAVVVKAIGPVEEAALSAISSKLVVVFGDPSFIPETIKSNKSTKLNLKKLGELPSNVVYLERK